MTAASDDYSVLAELAQAAEERGDWAAAASHWQLVAALANPISAKTLAEQAKNPEGSLQRSNYAQGELRNVRFNLANTRHAEGKKRAFRELVTRAVEMIPDQRVLKQEPPILEAVRNYVQDALVDDGIAVASDLKPDGKPRKIAIVLDILKLSDVQSDSHAVVHMCRTLMRLDESIETHIILTNERFAVTTPIIDASFNADAKVELQKAAQSALPEHYGTRFFLHNFDSFGLEGLVDTCKGIIRLNPDVLLYGGGNRGLFSTESRVVRNCLFDYYPSAFFYLRADNSIDDKLDMVIAGGPYEIIGDEGAKKVKVRVQPYPTFKDDRTPVPIDPAKLDNQIIVSAISGVQMDSNMRGQSEEDMAAFFSILEENPKAVWHVIGSNNPDALVTSIPQLAERVKSGQVVVHPVLPVDEFSQFVGQKASLFLHLPGFIGGSGSATIARRAGIPILTFRHSNVSGDQPTETIFDRDDVQKYVQMASRLLNTKTIWTQTVEAQFAHSKWIHETSAQGFYDCLTEAVMIGRTRMSGNENTLAKGM